MTTRTQAAVKLTIDGKSLQARAGETVLEVARREGINIPALCHQEGMPAWGACRLCLVEIEGTDKLQAACTTRVTKGMVVRTDTPRVRARRTRYLKMLLSDHNAYCEAPCSDACPAHVDIPGYLQALAAGELEKAAEIIRRELPFPGILGRVCAGYCESACRRGEVDAPIAICALDRAVADHVEPTLVSGPPTGKRVAVIGAGPAGLTAAWYLTELGHQVTLYDARENPGGPLRYAIPEFRLPGSVLERELQPLWDAGVRFVGASAIARDEATKALFEAGLGAVIIGTEVAREGATAIEGDELALQASDVLERVREGRPACLGGKVVVVGDGTAALDVARTAMRMGAEDVVYIAEHPREDLAADEHDLLDEKIKCEYDLVATRILANLGKVCGVECAPIEAGANGNGHGQPPLTIEADTVILAPGSVRSRWVFGQELPSEEVRIYASPYTGRTREKGVFATGEAISGGQSVIQAVASGKRTAFAVDAWLTGEDLEELEKKLARHSTLPYLEQLKEAETLGPVGRRLAEHTPVWLKMGIHAEPAARAVMPKAPVAKRLTGMGVEVEEGLTLDAARAEVERCLQCVCPSLGNCELQKLGVEYGLSENELIARDTRVRSIVAEHDHPFIRRDMNRCVACGGCIRICSDVAGPACYEFSGRGFDMSIDTPYSDSLERSGCISCGRCVTACPTGALTFKERTLESFRVDESRCVMCRECASVCPVHALTETDHFEEARTNWLELVAKGSGLAAGHRMCAGCGAPIIVRQVLMGTADPVVVSSATGCLEVSTTIYPYTSWKGSFIHTAFENSAATLSGVETAFRALKKKGEIEENVKFIAFGGDGGTYDIGLQSLSGAMERGHRMLYVCYDNGAYMNTGFQRSGATPVGAWTTTSPVGKDSAGKLQHRKNLTDIMVAHGLEYVAQASPHDPRDLVRKAAKALATDGPTFLNVLSPCPRGWRAEGADTIDLAREAVSTCYWPLFEVENGEYRLTYRPKEKLPLAPWLRRQGRFAHLFKPGNEEVLRQLEAWVDEEWEKLLAKCGEPERTK